MPVRRITVLWLFDKTLKQKSIDINKGHFKKTDKYVFTGNYPVEAFALGI